jgi:ubiquinone biosynthesis protein UbiJ
MVEVRMEDATGTHERGEALLLAHCEVIARLVCDERPDPLERLSDELGPVEARRLVDALVRGSRPAHLRPLWLEPAPR